MKYVLIVVFALFIYACENTRHSIGISGKPLSDNYEQGVKMNYKVIFGKVRNKNEEDD